MVAQAWGKQWGDERLMTKGYGISFGGDANVLKLTVVTVTCICEYNKKTLNFVLSIKRINSIPKSHKLENFQFLL